MVNYIYKFDCSTLDNIIDYFLQTQYSNIQSLQFSIFMEETIFEDSTT